MPIKPSTTRGLIRALLPWFAVSLGVAVLLPQRAALGRGVPAPHAFELPGLQRPGQALGRHQTTPTHQHRFGGLSARGPALPDRKEKFGIAVAARGTPHALRHTHATAMWEGGMRELALQKRLGHASPESTRIYTRVSDEQVLTDYQRALRGRA